MSLINGDEAHLHVLKLCLEQFGANTFGRHIQQFGATKYAVVERSQYLTAAHSRIYGCCNDATTAQVLHLVFHQGYERSHYYARSFHGKCRNLKRKRLASTRRHKSKCVLTLHYAVDDVALNATKSRISPVFVEDGKQRLCPTKATNPTKPYPRPLPRREGSGMFGYAHIVSVGFTHRLLVFI